MHLDKLSTPLKGELTIPGDKSISHRGIMFGSLAEGRTEITNFLKGADCLSTISCFRKMGIEISESNDRIIVQGKGLHGLTAPTEILDCGNSGTTTRLLSGILAGQNFESTITGDVSIQKRPMGRIIRPLRLMGADIESLSANDCAPLHIQGHPLHGIHYESPVASAQVKSCIMLAGLYSDAPTTVTEPAKSRDHSERMLRCFGANVTSFGNTVTILPDPKLTGQKLIVPGDISSAAYFLAAALMIPGSEVLLKNVGTNTTRDGILKVIKAMGGNVESLNPTCSIGEPTADLLVKHSSLTGTVIEGDLIPTLIDEIPIIAVLACYADGQTIIKNAEELKVKESNRLEIMVNGLNAMGADIIGTDDGMIINGGSRLHGALIDSHMDHRIAMAFTIASMIADTPTKITKTGCVDISYPTFYQDIQNLTR